MRRRFYFVLFVLALILLALPGFAAKAARRAGGHLSPRFALSSGAPQRRRLTTIASFLNYSNRWQVMWERSSARLPIRLGGE
jgi:hypothetical protein